MNQHRHAIAETLRFLALMAYIGITGSAAVVGCGPATDPATLWGAGIFGVLALAGAAFGIYAGALHSKRAQQGGQR